MTPSDVTETQTGALHEVRIEHGLCKACGICVSICPKQVFDEDEQGEPIVARLADCTACRLCEWHCPDFAIDVVDGAQLAAEEAGAAADAAEPADEHAERIADALMRARQRGHRHVPSDGGHHEEV